MIWREQESSGILRNPEESGVKSRKKTGITATPSKTTFL
jgi:hypothetical protein